jgi:hypothetical protein
MFGQTISVAYVSLSSDGRVFDSIWIHGQIAFCLYSSGPPAMGEATSTDGENETFVCNCEN